MRRKGTLTALIAAVASAAATVCAAAPAQAAISSIPFTTCPDAPTFGCAHLQVPLDPSGAVPGTVTLAIRRELSQTGAATTAVVALAGGPGQEAIPFASTASQIVSGALKTDDLIVFDQRGTGESGALRCSALSTFTQPISQVIPSCANEIGPSRAFYTTDDSVADIEAIRQALGYSKLILYGTSYGTKVALRYAAEYPQNVAGLLLDSTVPPNGPDIFDQSSWQAVPRILRQTCARGACAGVPHPLADLRRVLDHVDRTRMMATYVQGNGKPVHLRIGPDDIASILLAGDVDPSIRADFPAAIAAAATGRPRLLAVLFAHAVLGVPQDKTIDNPLYFATECEELPFPWTRTQTPAERFAAALAAAKAMPPGTFGPFSALTAFQESSAPDCAYWPFASAAPEPAVTALPDVPTLIISGAADMRTPTSNADAVAAMIPGAKVVVVPQTGHSVLTTEFSSCGRNAVNAFFAGTPIQTTCAPRTEPSYLQPAAAAPGSLAQVSPLQGVAGHPGRAARAFALTLGWSSRELSESLFETLLGTSNPAFSKGLGGLYGGYVRLTTNKRTLRSTLHFHGFSYVPGLTLSGRLTAGVGTLRLGGSPAVAGRLVARTTNDFVGTIGGVRVRFRISARQIAALTASAAR